MCDMIVHAELYYPRRTDDATGEWLAFWRKQSAWALPGYYLIEQSPDVVDGAKLEELWGRFCAALF